MGGFYPSIKENVFREALQLIKHIVYLTQKKTKLSSIQDKPFYITAKWLRLMMKETVFVLLWGLNGAFSSWKQFLATENPLKMMKSAFCS